VLPAHHRDPFDHLLIAQAICEGAVFLSADANVADYPVRVMSRAV
jgi:PIN domain nuclease of toxin-antitoxin system